MEKVLAELYGTLGGAPSTEGMQKTAELELLAKIAEDNGIDVNKLTDKQIMDAYLELHGAVDGGQEKVAAQRAQQEQMEKDAAEMFRNADYMGRIMAHSFINELNGIQKAAEEAAAEEKKDEGEKKEEPPKSDNPLADKIREMKEAKEEKKEEAPKEEEKTAAAIQVAIEKRAYEFLAAANLVNPDGTIKPPPALQKVAQEDIDRAALQLLERHGYEVTWKDKQASAKERISAAVK